MSNRSTIKVDMGFVNSSDSAVVLGKLMKRFINVKHFFLYKNISVDSENIHPLTILNRYVLCVYSANTY